MKITHSIVVLTVIVFAIGSIITSCMDSKKNTDNVASTISEAREKYNKEKQVSLKYIKKSNAEMDKEYAFNRINIAELNQTTSMGQKLFYRYKIKEFAQGNKN